MISCSVSNNDKMTNDMSMAYMFLLNNNNYQLTQPNFTKINIRCYLMQTHEQYKQNKYDLNLFINKLF